MQRLAAIFALLLCPACVTQRDGIAPAPQPGSWIDVSVPAPDLYVPPMAVRVQAEAVAAPDEQ